jgi:hypothetical protein
MFCIQGHISPSHPRKKKKRYSQQRKRQENVQESPGQDFDGWVWEKLPLLASVVIQVLAIIMVKRQFFSMSDIAMKSVQNLKLFWRSSQNHFVLALSLVYTIATFSNAFPLEKDNSKIVN